MADLSQMSDADLMQAIQTHPDLQPASPPGGVQPSQEPDVGMQGAFMSGVAHGATFGATPEHGADQHPIASAAGNIIGSLVSGAGEAKLGLAAAKAVAPKATAAVTGALALRGQQAWQNLVRLSGVGALSAGTQGATQGAVEGAQANGATGAVEGAATGGVAGAVMGAAAGPLAAGGMKIISKGVDMVADASSRSMQVFAKKLAMPVNQLVQVMRDYKSATGKNASIADVIDAKTKANLKDDVTAYQSSHAAMLDAASQNEAALPGAVQRQLKNLGSTQTDLVPGGSASTGSLNALADTRDSISDAAMKPIRSAPIVLDSRHAVLLKDPDVKAIARNARPENPDDPRLSERLGDATDAITPPTPKPAPVGGSNVVGLPAAKTAAPQKVNYANLVSRNDLTLGDVETLRKGLSEASDTAFKNGDSTSGIGLRNRAQQVAAIGRVQFPEYGNMLDEYAHNSRFIKGFEHASNGGSADNIPRVDPQLHADLQTDEGKAGLELGARTKMVDNASTETGAAGVINKARQPTAANKNLPVSEQNNQREMAQAHTTSQENYAGLSGGTLKSQESETRSALKTAGEAGFAALGVHATTGFKVHAIGRFLLGNGVRPSTANELVNTITSKNFDPIKLGQQIDALNLTASARRTVLANVARATGRPVGAFAASATAGAGQ